MTQLAGIPTNSELAGELSRATGKSEREFDRLDTHERDPNRNGNGQMNLPRLEMILPEIYGGACMVEGDRQSVYIVDNGDGKIGDGDLFVYEYYKKMSGCSQDINLHGFAKLFSPVGKMNLPAEIDKAVKQIERNKGQLIEDAFVKQMRCKGYED